LLVFDADDEQGRAGLEQKRTFVRRSSRITP